MKQPEPVFEKSIEIKPVGYTISVRMRPSTVRRTIVRLLPWALYVAMPQGRAAKAALFLANRISPLMKQRAR